MSMIDFRQPDIRDNVRLNPYYIASPAMSWDGRAGFSNVMDDNESVFASFPAFKFPYKKLRIHEVIWNVITAFTRSGGTGITMSLGTATIPEEYSTEGATVSNQTAEALVAAANVDEEVQGWKTPEVSKTVVITPADTNVPVLYVDTVSDGTITGGKIQFYLLVSEVG